MGQSLSTLFCKRETGWFRICPFQFFLMADCYEAFFSLPLGHRSISEKTRSCFQYFVGGCVKT